MMRFAVITLLVLFLAMQSPVVAKAAPSSSGSPSKSSVSPSGPPQKAPPLQPQNPEDEDKERHTPVGYYMLAAIAVALVLVVVCMPSRKG